MDLEARALENDFGDEPMDSGRNCADIFQAFGRFCCEAKAEGGCWFRTYSVWNGVFWLFSVCTVFAMLLVLAFFGQLFWALLETRPVWNLTTPLSDPLRFSHETYYAVIKIQPQVWTNPVSVKWTHVDTRESFVQIVGIGRQGHALISVNDVFPFQSDERGCPSFEYNTLKPGSYTLELIYDRRHEINKGKSSPSMNETLEYLPEKCNPFFERDAFHSTSNDNVDVKYIENEAIKEFKIYRGVSMLLYQTSRLSIGWVYYLLASFSSLLLISLLWVYRKYTRIKYTGYTLVCVIVGLTIAYRCTLPSATSFPLFVASVTSLLSPAIVLLYLVQRIIAQRRTIEQIEYSSSNRLLVIIRQLQEAGFSTESSIKTIIQPKRNSNNEGPTFKYYCPICMLYFKEIMKATCCEQYICEDCAKSFIYASGKVTVSADVDSVPDILPSLPCPYCTQEPFQLLHPKKSEPTRSYKDEVGSSKKTKSRNAALKIGDSFEDMKRKMILFEDMDKGTRQPEQDKNEFRPPGAPFPAFIHSSPHPAHQRHDGGLNVEDSPSAAPNPKHILPPIRRLDFGFHSDHLAMSMPGSVQASHGNESGLVPSLPNTPHEVSEHGTEGTERIIRS